MLATLLTHNAHLMSDSFQKAGNGSQEVLGFDLYVPKGLLGEADLIQQKGVSIRGSFNSFLFSVVFLLLLLYISSLKPFECE